MNSQHVLLAGGGRRRPLGVRVEPQAVCEAGAAGGGQRAGTTGEQLKKSPAPFSSLTSNAPLPSRAAPQGGVGGLVRAEGQRSIRGQGLLARVDGSQRLVARRLRRSGEDGQEL